VGHLVRSTDLGKWVISTLDRNMPAHAGGELVHIRRFYLQENLLYVAPNEHQESQLKVFSIDGSHVQRRV